MRAIAPPRLARPGTLRVVAPARSLSFLSPPIVEDACSALDQLGWKVTFGAHCRERDRVDSSPVASRLADLHDAFADHDVHGILTAIGGYNSVALLGELDFDLIRAHPKPLCGRSDITALLAAIHRRAGLVCYYGPHLADFGDVEGRDYTVAAFLKAVTGTDAVLEPSARWSDDRWFQGAPRRFHSNPGPRVLRPGRAEGHVVGGELSTLLLLAGTEYFPDLAGAVLFIEEAGPADLLRLPHELDRRLETLTLQPGWDRLAGLAIGRFPGEGLALELVRNLVLSRRRLPDIPIVAELDFGHTTPMATLPIGGRAMLEAGEGVRLRFELDRA